MSIPSLPCTLCTTETEAFADEKAQKHFHYCRNCEFIFLDPAALLSEEKEKERYTKHQNSLENEGYVRMHRAFIDLFKPFIKEPLDTALDFGCGPVPVLAQLMKEAGIAKRVTVYDKFFAEDFDPQVESFGLITCTEVLEHLADPLKYFTLFKQLLKHNGILAITTYFHTNSKIDFKQWWYKNDSTHIAFFSKRTLNWLAVHFDLILIFLNDKNSALFIKS